MKPEAMQSKDSHITEDTAQAAHWLKQGQLLAYPTESVWGIGCDAYDQQAVKRILAIKNRPIEKGMIVVTDSVQRIEPLLCNLSMHTQRIIKASWQVNSIDSQLNSTNKLQANTWLLPLPKKNSEQLFYIPQWITGKHDSLAVRVIAHPLITQLCENMVSDLNPFGFIVSTSCNPSGQLPATTFDQAYAYFSKDIYYLQGTTLGYTLPSQISDALTGKVIR